jgi:hypothetical protein
VRELRKQDRTSSRLPTDTERKYKLGQIELTAEEVEQLKSKLVVDEYLSATSSNAIANKTVTNALNNKVTKEEGKTLSSNDFTDEHIEQINKLVERITKLENSTTLDDDSGWIDIVPISGTAATGRYKPQYRKKNGVVYLRGYISDIGEEGTLVYTLPEGFRPTNRIRVLTIGDQLDTTISICRILESGNMYMFKTNESTGYLNLDNINYLVD